MFMFVSLPSHSDSDPSSPWSPAGSFESKGELTYGFLRNVQVAVQRDMANVLSISPFPVTNGALHVSPPSQCWDSCAIYIAHFYVLYK